MGPTKSIFHFSNGARANMDVSDIANELVGLPTIWLTSHCLV